MLNIVVSFFNISSKFVHLVPFVNKLLNARRKEQCWLLSQATEERLIAPQYLMQISAQSAFSYTKSVLLPS